MEGPEGSHVAARKTLGDNRNAAAIRLLDNQAIFRQLALVHKELPTSPPSPVKQAPTKAIAKRKKKTRAKHRRRKKPNGGSVKHPTSAFLLFCREKRNEIRQATGAKGGKEVQRLLGEAWRSLSLAERQVHMDENERQWIEYRQAQQQQQQSNNNKEGGNKKHKKVKKKKGKETSMHHSRQPVGRPKQGHQWDTELGKGVLTTPATTEGSRNEDELRPAAATRLPAPQPPPPTPKRPTGSYVMFAQEHLRRIQQAHPGLEYRQHQALVSQAWRRATREQKRVYIDLQKQASERYRLEKQAYKEWERQQQQRDALQNNNKTTRTVAESSSRGRSGHTSKPRGEWVADVETEAVTNTLSDHNPAAPNIIIPKTFPRKDHRGLYQRPRGRGPADMTWNAENGFWESRSLLNDAGKRPGSSSEPEIQRKKASARQPKRIGEYRAPAGAADDDSLPETLAATWTSPSRDPAPPNCIWDNVLGTWVHGDNQEPPQESRKTATATTKRTNATRNKKKHKVRYIRPKHAPRQLKDGTYQKPAGRPRQNCTWSRKRGMWKELVAPAPATSVSRTAPTVNTLEKDTANEKKTRVRQRPAESDGNVASGLSLEAENSTRAVPKEKMAAKLPKSPPQRDKNGMYKRPMGRPPRGFVWDPNSGTWMPKDTDKPAEKENNKDKPEFPNVARQPKSPPRKGSNGLLFKPGPAPPYLAWDAQQQQRVQKNSISGTKPKTLADSARLPKSPPRADGNGLFKRPRGPAPGGRAWDAQHGVWVSKKASASVPSKGRCKRPRGRPPSGHVWDDKNGSWVPVEKAGNSSIASSTTSMGIIKKRKLVNNAQASIATNGTSNLPDADSPFKSPGLPMTSRKPPPFVACGVCRSCRVTMDCMACLSCLTRESGVAFPCARRVCISPRRREPEESPTAAPELPVANRPRAETTASTDDEFVESLSEASPGHFGDDESDDMMSDLEDCVANGKQTKQKTVLSSAADFARRIRFDDRRWDDGDDSDSSDDEDMRNLQPQRTAEV